MTLPKLAVQGLWQTVASSGQDRPLLEILPAYLRARRWFRSKARSIQAVTILDSIPLAQALVVLIQVAYLEGEPEIYVLPLAFGEGGTADVVLRERPYAAIAQLQRTQTGDSGLLYDPSGEHDFSAALLNLIASRSGAQGREGSVRVPHLHSELSIQSGTLEPRVGAAEQSNTSVIYGDQFIMKIYRRLEEGINPDLEIGRFLTEERAFAHTPPVVGAIEYQGSAGEPMTLAILQGFVPNRGDAWSYSLDELEGYFQKVRAGQGGSADAPPLATGRLLEAAGQALPPEAEQLIGSYLDRARLLGRRTAELHLALTAPTDDPAFVPEPFTPLDQRALYEGMRVLVRQVLQTAREALPNLTGETREELERLLSNEDVLLGRFERVLEQPINALRARFHGDYHLGQVLYTGDDFMIIDFEGEPARPLSERRHKQSPLRDVAGMLRSFRYASHAALSQGAQASSAEEQADTQAWGHYWTFWVCAAFLQTYLETAGQAAFLPRSSAELALLLDALLLEKAVYELGYELNNRPTWVLIPLQGILQLLGGR